MFSEYYVNEFSDYKNLYKKVRKKYKHSFDEDHARALKVITRKLPLLNGNLEKLPNSTIAISGLGESVKLPIAKTRIHIKEARATTGRLIYLVDKKSNAIFLIDVYYHPDRDNHDKDRIIKAYKEYYSLLCEYK